MVKPAAAASSYSYCSHVIRRMRVAQTTTWESFLGMKKGLRPKKTQAFVVCSTPGCTRQVTSVNEDLFVQLSLTSRLVN
jgi:hypothetical protein